MRYPPKEIKDNSLKKPPVNMPDWVPYLNLCGIALLFIETFVTLLYSIVTKHIIILYILIYNRVHFLGMSCF